MKKFKVEGWYRYNGEKDFEQLTSTEYSAEDAIIYFCGYYLDLEFYKITVEEID